MVSYLCKSWIQGIKSSDEVKRQGWMHMVYSTIILMIGQHPCMEWLTTDPKGRLIELVGCNGVGVNR